MTGNLLIDITIAIALIGALLFYVSRKLRREVERRNTPVAKDKPVVEKPQDVNQVGP